MNILKPIELILLAVFNLSYTITSNYGISLLIMSVVITVGTYPLYYIADIWKEKELEVQKEMKGDIDKISNAFSGQKKFYLIQTTYRLHNYKSWYAFRTSLGILIQIPFFFAAYNVLSAYTGYQGCSFLFIDDLSKPDGLFGSLNFLPLLMTFFNVLSSIIFTKSIKFKDNIQQFVLAIVFLLFLYDSPAALLIYWTSNNFLSIFKSLIKFFKSKEKIDFSFDFNKDVLQSKSAVISILLFLIIASIMFCEKTSYIRFAELFVGGMNILIFVYTYLMKKHKLALQSVVLYLFYSLMFAIYLFKLIPFIGYKLLLLLLGYITCYVNLKLPVRKDYNFRQEYILSSLITFIIFFLIPINIYVGNIEEFSVKLGQVILSCVFTFIVFNAFIFITKILFFKKSSTQFKILYFIILSYFFYTLVFSVDYGLMSEFSFQKSQNLYDTKIWLYLKDFLVLFLIFLLQKYLFANKKKWIVLTLYGAMSFFVINISLNAVKIKNLNAGKENTDSVIDYNLTKFSSNKKNVLYIMSDMMNGNYFERYINEKPETKDILDGFIWYKDTLSVASATINTMPVLYAGYNYNPEELNKTGLKYNESVMPGVTEFWKKVLEQNYTVANIYEWPGLNVSENVLKNEGYDTSDYKMQSCTEYIDMYSTKNGIILSKSMDKIFLLQILPIFLSSPNILKKYIYDNGIWNNVSLQINARRRSSLVGVSYFGVFEDVTNVINTDKNSFIYILSNLTHDSYGINENGNLISTKKELYDPDLPYYSAKKFLDEFVKIILWLKENNIYDNTLIVVCSDHGNAFKDNDLCYNFNELSLEQQNDLSKAHAMLLTKDFRANEKFTISNSLMQNGDAYYYVKEKVFNDGNDFTNLGNTIDRQRFFYACNDNFADFKERKTVNYTKYKVDGSMFSQESWDFNK